ncbi:leucine-rich repeat extensin-like protein 5 [Cyprinodon tularosa]|uniref:leucine-rich repeat extensin-like protein 5 n=1 Tax=Cyprinodon tularosa TaxID=77115 RepID=UPI0018E276C5|nr:leucine-rich repeat extensin-like protein 5 [Cyprinodon tularosa]
MGSGRNNHSALCIAVAVLLVCCLVQPSACLRLKKRQIQVKKRDANFATTAGVQEGKIVFGKVLEVPVGNQKSSSNDSVDDTSDYQADFPGWSQPMDMNEASMKKWNSLGTSLHCFGDHMKFRYLGPGASQFSVMQANGHPIPLSMLPSRCGFRMHGNSMAFVMIAPYQGCNMIQQGENVMLPLLWQGNPLSLLCPKHISAGVQLPQQGVQLPQQGVQLPQQGVQLPQQGVQLPQQGVQPLQQSYFGYSYISPALAGPTKPAPIPRPQTTIPPPALAPKVPNPHTAIFQNFPLWNLPQFRELQALPYPIGMDPKHQTSQPRATEIPSTTTAPTSPQPTQTVPQMPNPKQSAVPPQGPQVLPMDFSQVFDFHNFLQAASEAAKPVPYFPSYPTTAPPSTAVQRPPYPHVPFDPNFPWPYPVQFPAFHPIFAYPPEGFPSYPVPEQNPATSKCSTTQAASDSLQWNPMPYVPLIPNEQDFLQMLYSSQGQV